MALRILSLGWGIALLLAAESLLWLCGLGEPDWQEDPFLGFSPSAPLFTLSADRRQYETAPNRLSHFAYESFPAQKPAQEFRIFCVGDSTVQGSPWSNETSFTTWLELRLQAAEPSRDWNVVNCGGISYASFRMVPIVAEVLDYSPDLLIIHCSHNEFLEDCTYAGLKQTPQWIWKLHEWGVRWRLYNTLRSGARQLLGHSGSNRWLTHLIPHSGRAQGPLPEVDARLDWAGGLAAYHHDPQWQADVLVQYRFHVQRMVGLARDAGIPVVLLKPACKLRDCPPFKAEPSPTLSADQRQAWTRLWEDARRQFASHPQEALQLLDRALAIDNQHAGLHYDRARCLESFGQFDAARQAYEAAKEQDVCPLRILHPFQEALEDIGRNERVPLVDLPARFAAISRHGIAGGDWFVDHVHPSLSGYQRIADWLVEEMTRQKLVKPVGDWQSRARIAYESHERALPTVYFTRGEERLRALRVWTEGRVARERPGPIPADN